LRHKFSIQPPTSFRESGLSIYGTRQDRTAKSCKSCRDLLYSSCFKSPDLVHSVEQFYHWQPCPADLPSCDTLTMVIDFCSACMQQLVAITPASLHAALSHLCVCSVFLYGLWCYAC